MNYLKEGSKAYRKMLLNSKITKISAVMCELNGSLCMIKNLAEIAILHKLNLQEDQNGNLEFVSAV